MRQAKRCFAPGTRLSRCDRYPVLQRSRPFFKTNEIELKMLCLPIGIRQAALCLHGIRGRLKALAGVYSAGKYHISQTACCGCARVPKYCQRICGLAQSGHTQASAQPPHKPAKPCQPLWPPMCNFACPPCRHTPACGKSAGKSSPAALIKASLVHHKR